MHLAMHFNPITAYDPGLERRVPSGPGGQKGGAFSPVRERIVYSTPWLVVQPADTRKEYLEALERPDKSWDVIRHEMFYAHGRWREDGVELVAMGLSAEELSEFLKDYEDQQEGKAREAATVQKLKPKLDEILYHRLAKPESKMGRKTDRKPEVDLQVPDLKKPVAHPPVLETKAPGGRL